jgi:ABC-type protease/lipase transport system fused ATPase/permease subunit
LTIRLNRFLEETPSRKKTMPLPPPVGLLSVEDLTARAPGSSTIILSKVTFRLNPGTCLAVMGPSGSGKSSLARLLVGVWPSVSGSVRLDNVDVHSWDKDELGPHLGYLPQDIEILDGSIEDNICRFGPVDSVALERAIALVGLTEFVENLPHGLQTQIIDGGSMLSGGQRHRLGLARAIYGRPRLVVLDEPNANLDQEGTESLFRTVGDLTAAGSTVVIVTHKKDILQMVDRILILKDGSPQIFGPRDLVLDKLAGKEVKTITPAQAAKLHQKT